MELSYGDLKQPAAAVAAALADARSARNLLSRRKSDEDQDERQAEAMRRSHARKAKRELEEMLRRQVRVKVPMEERPKIGVTTARKLYHRAAGQLLGATGLTDARGPDGLYSIHFAFTARGFASTKGRRWRRGEAERAARYIVREDGLERGELGWWSSIAGDRNELVAFYRAVEALERHDRSNANVYISEVIALPAELTARQRRRVVRRICRFFEERGLPYTVAIHLPDSAGDQRNFHCHIIYSLRPCERVGPYDWNFGVAKEGDINTPDGIKTRRIAAVQAINTTLNAAGIAKRYTHLSNKARRMAAGQAKVGQQRTWARRRLEAMEAKEALLRGLAAGLGESLSQLRRAASRLQQVRATAIQRLEVFGAQVGTGIGVAHQLDKHLTRVRGRLAAARLGIHLSAAAATARLNDAHERATLRLRDQSAGLIASDCGSRVLLARAIAAERLTAGSVVLAELRTSQPRLGLARLAASQQLQRSSSQIATVSEAQAKRSAAVNDRAPSVHEAEVRRKAVVSSLERLGQRTVDVGRAVVPALIQLSTQTKAWSDSNREGRIKLAGIGAIAELREERSRQRARVEAINTRLQDHKAFLDRARRAVASSAVHIGETVAGRLQGTQTRLAAISRSPNLQRASLLSEMLIETKSVALATARRFGDARDHARERMTGTANEMRWAMRGAEAALGGLGETAQRRRRLTRLTDCATAIKASITNIDGRSLVAAQTAATMIGRQRAMLSDSLAAQLARLERVGQTARQIARADAEQRSGQIRDARGVAPKVEADPNGAPPPSANTGSRSEAPTRDPANFRRHSSAAESLRKGVRYRTPETDIQSSVPPPGDRGPISSEKTSKLGAMWKRMRGDVKAREPDVQAKVRQHALRRLRVSQAAIMKDDAGVFTVDDRGLLADERHVLRDPAHRELVQAALAKLWQAQEIRRHAAKAAKPSSGQAAGVDLGVQSAFLARRSGLKK